MTVIFTDDDVCDGLKHWLEDRILRLTGNFKVNWVAKRNGRFIAEIYDVDTGRKVLKKQLKEAFEAETAKIGGV